MAVWVCNFTQASLGPHLELQFSVFVTRRPVQPVCAHPLAALEVIAFNPDVRMLCARLWNSTPTAVRYNTELLGLNAQLTQGKIEAGSDQIRFAFAAENGDPIFEGSVSRASRQPMNVIPAMMSLFGPFRLRQLRQMPWLSMQVVNPISDQFPHHAEAQAYSASDAMIARFFDPATDSIQFGQAASQALDFCPSFIEQITHCKFVYLNIHNLGESAYIPPST